VRLLLRVILKCYFRLTFEVDFEGGFGILFQVDF